MPVIVEVRASPITLDPDLTLTLTLTRTRTLTLTLTLTLTVREGVQVHTEFPLITKMRVLWCDGLSCSRKRSRGSWLTSTIPISLYWGLGYWTTTRYEDPRSLTLTRTGRTRTGRTLTLNPNIHTYTYIHTYIYIHTYSHMSVTTT